jgi:hypothetical protein
LEFQKFIQDLIQRPCPVIPFKKSPNKVRQKSLKINTDVAVDRVANCQNVQRGNDFGPWETLQEQKDYLPPINPRVRHSKRSGLDFSRGGIPVADGTKPKSPSIGAERIDVSTGHRIPLNKQGQHPRKNGGRGELNLKPLAAE